jgi:hypothetical protein
MLLLLMIFKFSKKKSLISTCSIDQIVIDYIEIK